MAVLDTIRLPDGKEGIKDAEDQWRAVESVGSGSGGRGRGCGRGGRMT